MSIDLVWKYSLQSHNEIKQSMLNLIDLYEQKEQCPDYQCPDHITKTDFFDSNRTCEYMNIFTSNSGSEHLRKTICEKYWVDNISIGNSWFQQYFKGDFHRWHLHNSTISMTYFLELDDKKYSTEFIDIEKKKTFQLNVTEGDVVIFPSHLLHRSPIIKSKNRKTSIALNVYLNNPDYDKIENMMRGS